MKAAVALAVAVVVAVVAVAGIEAAPVVELMAVLPRADAVETPPPPPPVEPAGAEFVAFALFSSQCSSRAVAIVASMWKYHCRPQMRELSDKVIPPSSWPFGEDC